MKKLTVNEMQSIDGGRMKCGIALGLYAFAFVGLCAATGGFAICAVAAFGASVYDVVDACR